MPNLRASVSRAGIEVDADDHVGARHAGALDDVEPDAAQSEYDDVRARLDLGRVDHRADAGGDAATDVADLVERRVLADLRHRNLRQDREVGERGASHVVMHGIAAQRKPAGAVGHHPLPCVARIAVHRLVLRDRHDLHCRHSGV